MVKPELVFLSGKRTCFGMKGGVLKSLTPTDLGVAASRAAFDQAKVDPTKIDHVIFGSVLHSAPDSIYVPRHIGLYSGVPLDVPALGINRLCGTGFQVIVEAFQQMSTGDCEVALVGGVENLSMAPYVMREARVGQKLGHSKVFDSLEEIFFDSYVQSPMALTAENLAERYKLSRVEVDHFAFQSQKRYALARERGFFSEEIVSISLPTSRGGMGTQVFLEDEHPRPQTTLEGLAQLKPLFKKEGVVTAGNASGIVDGACAMIVSTHARAIEEGWKPLGKLISYGISGCDPKYMGIGPVSAAQEALKRAGLQMDQMDLVEINEAFAPQTLAVLRECKVHPDRLNVNGGAIAMGHPLAASGTRIMMHLIYELKRRKKRLGLGSACIGGGQGIAMIVEVFS